jgi:hypothetical protein
VSLRKMEPLSPSSNEVEWWQPCVWTHRCSAAMELPRAEARRGLPESKAGERGTHPSGRQGLGSVGEVSVAALSSSRERWPVQDVYEQGRRGGEGAGDVWRDWGGWLPFYRSWGVRERRFRERIRPAMVVVR